MAIATANYEEAPLKEVLLTLTREEAEELYVLVANAPSTKASYAVYSAFRNVFNKPAAFFENKEVD